MSRFSMLKLLLVFGFVLGLAACESSEERAEAHYQSGLQLLEEGDDQRAAVEFRNVLQLNGQHREARLALAKVLRDGGQARNAYSQYLRLAEQYVDDVEARIALAEIAIESQNWDEARRHGARAIELASQDPAVEIIALNLTYADAIEAENAPARREVARAVQERLVDNPTNLLLRRILVDSAILDGEFGRALDEIETAQITYPDNRTLYDTKLGLLAQLERGPEIEAVLREMLVEFPEDEDLPGVLLRFYVATGNTENAEIFLRETAEAAEDEEGRRAALTTVVQLIQATQGDDAAMAELETLIATEEDTTNYRAVRAGMLFNSGQRDAGLAEMEALLETPLVLEESSRLQVGMAQMLILTGDSVGARALVEEVLQDNPTQPDALKIKAGWLIEGDETDEAIGLLRLALGQDGDDTEALSLTAQAYIRNGDRNLAREFMALAVEASNSAPAESLRYAEQLIEEDRYVPAEEILLASLRLASGNQQLLQRLGGLYLLMEDWGRMQQVEETFLRFQDPTSDRIAAGLQASRLAAQGRMEDAVAILESFAIGAGEGDLSAKIAVIQARLASGDEDGALSFAQDMVAEAPDDLSRRFALAAIQSALGEYDASIGNYRNIIEVEPRIEQAWINIIRATFAQGDIEGAQAVLQEGLDVLPDAINLLWAQAGFSEQRGDIDGAIDLYEMIYERAPNELVAANNLASLLSTYRMDDSSLDRAHTIARRLSGTDIAPFQDTYGWIAYRRGNLEEALEYLEPAAEGLAADPLVQYHLAMTYAGLGRDADALVVFQRALEVAGPEDDRPQFDTARAEVERIQAAEAALEQ
jgi:tetratricopeptide (TPR) repeat protein